MKCDEALHAMQAALDEGRTSLPESVRLHVAACAGCRRAWRQLLDIEAGLAGLGAESIEPPAGLHGSIMRALEGEKPLGRPRSRARRLVAASGLAAAALVVIFAVHLAALNRAETAADDRQVSFVMPTLAFDERALDPFAAEIVRQSGDDLSGLARSFQVSLASAQNAVQ